MIKLEYSQIVRKKYRIKDKDTVLIPGTVMLKKTQAKKLQLQFFRLWIKAYLFAISIAAPIKPLNSGCGWFGLDLNSGCACVATYHG